MLLVVRGKDIMRLVFLMETRMNHGNLGLEPVTNKLKFLCSLHETHAVQLESKKTLDEFVTRHQDKAKKCDFQLE